MAQWLRGSWGRSEGRKKDLLYDRRLSRKDMEVALGGRVVLVDKKRGTPDA